MLPPMYASMSEDEASERIAATKTRLGSDLVILAHHYQRDSIVQFGDYVGDSLELSRRASEVTEARTIVFCGVDFMAETAAMLCGVHQTVLIPAKTALCPMAAMATRSQAAVAWNHLSTLWNGDLLPITYQNSYANLKAFCGEHGGAVCTSANAQALFRWALSQKGHLLFFPDEHLGRNTALALGIPESQIAVWNRRDPNAEAMEGAKVVIWKGYCHVHTRFSTEHVAAIRREHPEAKIIVHPECPAEVVALADANGSTSYILRYVNQLPAGATVAVGTEIHMVERLARQNPDKTVLPLARSKCHAMYNITPQHLAYTLNQLMEGNLINPVTVPEETKRWANEALERMLTIR